MLFEENPSLSQNPYPWTQDFIDAIWSGFWTANEFSFESDYSDFKTRLTEQERKVVVRVLVAISQVEVRVKKFWHALGEHFQHSSIHDLGTMLSANEVIHAHAYKKLLVKLGLEQTIDESMNIPVLSKRAKYLTKHLQKQYVSDKKQYLYSLILFTLFVENTSLFSQFYILLWFDRHCKVLRDTAQQVKYTRNEELLHGQVGAKLINTLRLEYPELFDEELESKVLAECTEAFIAESEMIDWLMVDQYSGPGLSADLLKNYVKERLNESLSLIGFKPQFQLDPELSQQSQWMKLDLLSNPRVDQFHVHPTAYIKAARPFDDGDMF